MPASQRPPFQRRTPPSIQPLNEREIDELQDLLDQVPAPLEPLDVSMADGFICGVLLQPQKVPTEKWLPHLTDVDARTLPASFDATRLHVLAKRRYNELQDAISRRQWFDPWVFELDGGEAIPAGIDDDTVDPQLVGAVYPWVAGFVTALELFPELMQFDSQALTEPLALVYRHLDPEDLEDADELIEEIEALEPPTDLSEAIEGLVRATLLLADISRPIPPPSARSRPPLRRPRQR